MSFNPVKRLPNLITLGLNYNVISQKGLTWHFNPPRVRLEPERAKATHIFNPTRIRLQPAQIPITRPAGVFNPTRVRMKLV